MKISKAKMTKFVKAVTKLLLDIGAVKTTNDKSPMFFEEFDLQTVAGLLKVKLDTESSAVYTIFSSYEDDNKLKDYNWHNEVVSKNGKYNYHGLASMEIEDVLDDVKRHFMFIL